MSDFCELDGLIWIHLEFLEQLHPRKLTWNPKMEVWKMIFPLKPVIFRFHVSFWGCKHIFFRTSFGSSSPSTLWLRISQENQMVIRSYGSPVYRSDAPEFEGLRVAKNLMICSAKNEEIHGEIRLIF